METARAFADQLIIQHGSENPADLINDAFRQLTSRYPTEKEAIILSQLLSEQKTQFTIPKRPKNFLKSDTIRQNQKIFLTWLR